MRKVIYLDIISYLLFILFVYAAISKLITFYPSRVSFSHQPVIGRFASILIFAVPAIELLSSGLLLTIRLKTLGFYLSLILMCIFTIYVGLILAFVPSEKIPCSCGGLIRDLTWSQHLIFNIIFTLLALIGLRLSQRMQTGPIKKLT